jgi:hypothetical protein
LSQKYYREELERSRSYRDLFALVKKAVKKVLGRNRAGLMLYLGDLPLHVGALHQVGSNGIVLNRQVLEIVSRTAGSDVEMNSFLFTLLLHEYLHSLGCLDEGEVRRLVHHVSSEIFGEDHPTVNMAINPPLPKILPQDMHGEGRNPNLELVKEFEEPSHPYIA